MPMAFGTISAMRGHRRTNRHPRWKYLPKIEWSENSLAWVIARAIDGTRYCRDGKWRDD